MESADDEHEEKVDEEGAEVALCGERLKDESNSPCAYRQVGTTRKEAIRLPM